VAQWDWVAVRKFAATPPAVYFRTLTATTLKVNANIAGTGSFLIGSSSYSINYPQWTRILVNGTITIATFNCYGEQRSPLWDYLAADAASGATTIVLQNGLPLRSGDLIAIGRSDIVGHWSESSTARGLHTVASYNPDTKTVTLNEVLTHARSGTGVRACLVILLSRQIVISKYGTNNVTLLSGSGRTIQGVLFQAESGATVHSATTATSSSFTYSSHIGFSGPNTAFLNVSGITLDNHTAYSSGGNASIRDPSGTNQITNSAFINASHSIFWFINISSTWTLNNIHLQNCPAFHGSGSGSITCTLQQCTCKNNILVTFHTPSGTGPYTLTLSDVTLVDGSLVGSGPAATVIANISDIQMHGYLANDYSVVGQVVGMVVVKNLTGAHNNTARRITLAGSRADNVVFINCSLSGYGNGLGHNGAADCKYISCSLANAFNPIIQNHPSGVSEIINLSTNAYFRPTLRIPSIADPLWTNRIIVKGLTVAGTQHPKAFEHLFPHGYVKNRWDAATPDYTTFDFLLTQASFVGQPIWLEYQVFTSDPIRVTGTITQLGTGESVKVQIFSAGKEPLYGDTPDFEQSYMATGDISVNWTPPDARNWIVRILAYPQQTTNPITIANLQVAGGGAGGDGGGQTYNVNVSDSVTSTLSDSVALTHSLNLSDGISATLSDQATLSAPISLSDSLNPTLSDSASAQVNASATDSIAATLSDSGAISAQISTSDNIAPTLQDSANLTHSLAVSDSLAPTLSDSAQTSAQVSTTDSIVPTLSENVSTGAIYQVGVSDQVTPTLSDSAQASAQVSATDSITPTLSENVSAGNVYEIGVSDNLTATLQEEAQAQAQVSSTEAITATLSENVSAGNVYEVGISDQITPTLSDSSAITGQVLATESINPTLSESVTAGNIYEIGVSDQVTPTLSDSSTVTGQITATETITPTLQDSGGAQVQITQTEAINPTIQEAPSVSATLSASDAIAPTLQDSGQFSAQVAATETINPTLQENVAAGNVYNVGVSDGVTATLSETISGQASIAATDSVAPTLAEDVLAGNIYDISVADSVTPTLTESATGQAAVTAQETINATLTEQTTTTPQVSVSESLSPTLQESASVSPTLTISEQVTPTLQEATSATAQVSATETLSPTLQDSSGTQAQITQTDTIAPTLQDALSTSTTLSVSDTIAPELQDTLGAQIGVSASETITTTLQEQATVFSGGTVLVAEPLEISLKEDELQLELDED
jgi:hypothetical protein